MPFELKGIQDCTTTRRFAAIYFYKIPIHFTEFTAERFSESSNCKDGCEFLVCMAFSCTNSSRHALSMIQWAFRSPSWYPHTLEASLQCPPTVRKPAIARWNWTADTGPMRAKPLSGWYSAAMEDEVYRDTALGANLEERDSA